MYMYLNTATFKNQVLHIQDKRQNKFRQMAIHQTKPIICQVQKQSYQSMLMVFVTDIYMIVVFASTSFHCLNSIETYKLDTSLYKGR